MRTQRFGQDPPPSFSAPTPAYTYRQWKRDLRLCEATSSLQKTRQGGRLLRQLRGESRTAAEVVMDDALVQDDGIDLIVDELDLCWEVTQNQNRASKIEKPLFETQRDVKTETTYMSYVVRRKLNFQQMENALGTPLPAVIKGYATLRDAKLAESSYDNVVMWTSGSYEYDDVVRALVRLDRPEMRPGTSGQSGKTIPTYFTDPELDAPTAVSGSEIWTQPSTDRPHWNEALDATSPGETQRHGTLWTVKHWKRFAHYMLYVRCAAFFDTLSRELLMLIPTGRSEDIQLALRRWEQREIKNKKKAMLRIFWGSNRCAAKPYREATGEHRGRRRRTTAIIPRPRSRREATP